PAHESERAALASGRDAEARAGLGPGGEALLDRSTGIEPFEVFLARLDEARQRNLALDHLDDRLAVGSDERADIGIEADGRVRRSEPQRRDHRGPMPLDRSERADMEVPPR